MAQVTVLGGCGAVGSVAVRTLVQYGGFQVVVGDWNIDKARSMAVALGPAVTAVQCDARDPHSVRSAIQGSDVVLNCVGPFYSTVKPILNTVVEAGINYVDVCDDVDVTLDILAMDADVRRAGVAALIGMGSSPGLTNVIARLAADSLLDCVEAIDIFHTHGGEPVEGAGVIGHRFHCMAIPIPMYLDGKLQYVDFFGDDGVALRQSFDFPYIGPTKIYPYPHPEQVTLPQHIPLRQVTNKGSVLPEPYYDLIRDLARLGLSSAEPVDVKGQSVIPSDFAIAYVLRERERILQETGFGQQRGCVSVVARGSSAGRPCEPCEYRFHMASTSQALGEGTGIPAAIGAMLMQRGQVQGKGVLPPEACIRPAEFLPLALDIFGKDAAAKGKPGEGLIVERVDETGAVTQINL
jgi:saccharopine dehydrogenase-like NADP-dependent oxidoreductase